MRAVVVFLLCALTGCGLNLDVPFWTLTYAGPFAGAQLDICALSQATGATELVPPQALQGGLGPDEKDDILTWYSFANLTPVALLFGDEFAFDIAPAGSIYRTDPLDDVTIARQGQGGVDLVVERTFERGRRVSDSEVSLSIELLPICDGFPGCDCAPVSTEWTLRASDE